MDDKEPHADSIYTPGTPCEDTVKRDIRHRMTVKFAGLALSLFLLSGCQERRIEQTTLQDLKEEIQHGVRRALEGAETLAHSRKEITAETEREIEKIFTFEYKVEEVTDGAPKSLEERLAALGHERWECFHIQQRADKLRLFCKRAPKSYLRYIPRLF